jgi:hypothetical protein
MSEVDRGLHHAVAPDVTRDETRNTFDEDHLTFGEAGSSLAAKRRFGWIGDVPQFVAAQTVSARRRRPVRRGAAYGGYHPI